VATFVLTVLGDDRPGLVSALSAPINAHGASWERSQMSRLAGKFAGIAVVSVADDRYDALVAELDLLAAEGLQVAHERTDEADATTSVRVALDLLGADRPGIVAEISAALAALDINIEELSTDVRDAPMAGGTLFEAHAVLDAPSAASTETLRARLEELADELMVDISLSTD
jgi:glycine cleavage system regulatory protein